MNAVTIKRCITDGRNRSMADTLHREVNFEAFEVPTTYDFAVEVGDSHLRTAHDL